MSVCGTCGARSTPFPARASSVGKTPSFGFCQVDMYDIIPMYLSLTAFTKTLPQMSFHICFAICVRSGAPPLTQLTAGALTDPQLPVTASNVCAARDISRLLEIWKKIVF